MRSRGLIRVGAMFLLTACALAGAAQNTAVGDFEYSGDNGPGFWSKFDARCAPSATGRQSPIDLNHVLPDPALQPLNLTLPKIGVTLTNTGHTIMADPRPGSLLMIHGRTYSLLNFHFHTLAEHTVEGRRGVMELHAVFEDSDKDYAVVGVIYRIGAENPFLEKLIAAGLPEQTKSPGVRIKELTLADAFTSTASYFTYAGSLTTPPCSENVSWLVLKQWAELSPKQFESFRRILGNDFRPLQDRNLRVVRVTAKAEDE